MVDLKGQASGECEKFKKEAGKVVTEKGQGSGVMPFIPASVRLPEATLKALLLGILLAVLLAGSNAYLGLKMGQTISASIPAAVISMAVLRAFRTSNILENNIVQTIASAGEVVAAGIVFTIPALVVMGYWKNFGYWQVTFIAIVGGILGIAFSIPLRRALIVESALPFPEGVATAEVLKAGVQSREDSGSKGIKFLVIGSGVASLLKLCQSAFHLLSEEISIWFRMGSGVVGAGTGFSISMIGAGYIVGMGVAINLLVGTVLAWGCGVPFYSFLSAGPQDFGLAPDADAFSFAMAIRAEKLRYIGVGMMVFGGLWALVSILKPIRSAIASSLDAVSRQAQGGVVSLLRTEHDIPMHYVVLATGGVAVLIFALLHHVLSGANLSVSPALYWGSLGILTIAVLVIGFICSAIGGYMAGIVGSSANPLSGITIGAILLFALAIIGIFGWEIQFGVATVETLSLAAVTLMIGAVIAVAACFGCDNLQDLKAGQLVGSTPWKQQLTLLVGAVAGALVVAPILELLFQAYGIGGVFPRPGMDVTQALSAPQAILMASVAQGIFENLLAWDLLGLGFGLGIGVVLVDKLILAPRQSSYRLSVLAVSLGIYLPMDVTVPLILGGLIQSLAQRRLAQKSKKLPELQKQQLKTLAERQTLLLAAGMIAGDALLGIFLAVPFAAYQSTSVFVLVGPSFEPWARVLGTVCFGAIGLYMYLVGHRVKSAPESQALGT